MADPDTTAPDDGSYRSAIVANLLGPFGSTPPIYRNPQFLTPSSLDFHRKLAQQLMAPTQVHRPMEGIANLLRSAIGGNELFQADQAAQSAQASYNSALGRVAAAGRGDAGQPQASTAAGDGGDQPMAYAPSSDGRSSSSSATPAGFDGAVNRTLGFEGGYSPRDANGAPVNYGINQGANPDINVANLTPDQAKSIYRDRYWNTIDGDNLPANVQKAAFDTSVMAGPERAKQMLAQSGGDPNKFMDLREQYLGGLLASDPNRYGRFAQSWANRNAGLRSDIASMSGGEGNAGNAAAAIDTAAPQSGSTSAPPQRAMAFSGQPPTPSGMLGTPPPGFPPPGSGPRTHQQAIAHALIHGPTQPSGPSPQDLALALSSPFGSPEGRAVASHMITPTIVSDSVGNSYAFRNGQPPTPLLPGSRVQMVQVGNQNVPIAISGDPRNPTVRLLSPNDASPPAAAQPDAAPNSTSMPSGGTQPADRPTRVGPMAGYGSIIEQGQGISAQGAAAEHAGAASGDQYARDRAVAGDFATSTYPLQQAAQALDALGPTGTGPGTEGLNRVKSILQSAGFPGFDASKIQNYDDARQFIAGYVGQHGGTSKLVGAFSGDPTTNVSNAAASDLVKSALALQRMQQAKVLAFRQSGLPESQYSDFASDFASRSDPRAYGLDQMSDAAKQKLYASMPAGSPERARFAVSVRNALQTGILTQPGQSKN